MKFNDMKRGKKTCMQCMGIGRIFLRPRIVSSSMAPYITCDMCEGTGKCEGNLLWQAQGMLMKEWRLHELLTLREASKKYKIDPSNLSKMERGIIKPDPEYFKNTVLKS